MRNNRFVKIEDNLKLYVETYGDKDDEACLFIAGAGANSSFWSDRLCLALVENGFFVIKYDHRDFGYSSKIDFDKNPYDVLQLAKDAVMILDALEVKKTQVIGHSMGGFIAQLLGIHFPDRVLCLISASASTNSPEVPLPPAKTWDIFMENSPTNNLERDLEGFMPIWEHLNGIALFDEELALEYTKNLYKRQEVSGALGETHVKAQANLTDRTELLKQIEVPTLVIHGEEDYLVDKFGGIQTAECINTAELLLIPKMGHMPFNEIILERFENEIIRFIKNNRNENSK